MQKVDGPKGDAELRASPPLPQREPAAGDGDPPSALRVGRCTMPIHDWEIHHLLPSEEGGEIAEYRSAAAGIIRR